MVSDIPAHRETLGEAGLLFPAGDAVALRQCLRRLLDEPDLRAQVGERARRAVAPLSWERSADGLGRLVREAAGV